MKKSHIALIALSLPSLALAQSAIDAQQISQPDLKGTARFMSMGGAFTALGGDLSTLGQNPAGIGVYRRSEVGATLDLDFQSSKTPLTSPEFGNASSQTKAYCNNFGYIGSTNLDGALRTFNWGVSYNRATSFDRVYCGYVPQTQTSLSNYIAAYSTGIKSADMEFQTNYDPYLDSSIDWLSILAYNTYMISPSGNAASGGNTYDGLFKQGTVGDALFNVIEKGYVDEYDISFGGNVEDMVYWGITFGITDLNYKRWAIYSESMGNAGPQIPSPIYDAQGKEAGIDYYDNGSAYFNLDNYKYINGSGWNIKAGVIIKPINEFRFGLAVHTPTWYKLNQGYDAVNDFVYTPTDLQGNKTHATLEGSEYSDNAYFDWRFSAPWRLMVGAAAVLGQQCIVSLDYEFDGYNSMRISTPVYDNYGYAYDFVSNNNLNGDITSYFRNASQIRAGVEYRVTPQFSLRAGYNLQGSNIKKEADDTQLEIMTSGTDPSYTFDSKIQHFSFGLGYKYQAWYIDAAYVYRDRTSTYHAYTNWGGHWAPAAQVTDHNSQVVISTGFKF